MAWRYLLSEITVGTLRWKAVNDVHIKKSMHSYITDATIKVPSVVKYRKGKSGVPILLSFADLIHENDPVTIKLAWPSENGDIIYREEFRGFVKRTTCDQNMEIECEGYERQLRLNVSLSKNYKETTVKDLLLDICEGTDISVKCMVDVPLRGINLVKADGCRVIDHIKKVTEGALTIFFIEPDVLWCGLVYTPYLAGSPVFDIQTVRYRIGYNVPDEQPRLKRREPSEPLQIIINGKLANGDPVRTDSKDKIAKRKVQYLLNNIGNEDALKSFAQEKEHEANYRGYEGTLEAFYEPYCLPGYDAVVTDDRDMNRSGTYLVESTEVIFGTQGAWRKPEIGLFKTA